MTSLIERVYKSRNTIREIYKDYEWDTSSIPDISPQELESIFNTYQSNKKYLTDIGDGLAFTLTIPHQHIQDHNLVVIYYNLSNTDEKKSKTTKSIVNRVKELYENEYVKQDDSLLIVVNDSQSESLYKLNHMINHEIHSDYSLSSQFHKYIYNPEKETKDLMNRYNQNIFRQCVLLSLDVFQVNLLKHDLVPKHETIYDKKDIKKLCSNYNMTEKQMPVIHRHDIIAKIIRLCVGDVCKITRYSQTSGESVYYRMCR